MTPPGYLVFVVPPEHPPANQTAKATEEIQAQVQEIQQATSGAQTAVEGIGQTIGRVNEIAATIASAVEQQNAATRDISSNIQQAARGTQEVSGNIVGVKQAAAETVRQQLRCWARLPACRRRLRPSGVMLRRLSIQYAPPDKNLT